MTLSTSNAEVITHSLDYDGFLASENFKKILSNWQQKNANAPLTIKIYEELIRALLKENNEYLTFLATEFNTNNRHILNIGSDRQSGLIDETNGIRMKSKSCYPFFEALVAVLHVDYKIDVKLNKLLLHDILTDSEPGKHFDECRNAALASPREYLSKEEKAQLLNVEKEFHVGKNKISLLITQIQLAFKQGCTKFRFADDAEDIVKALQDFFENNNQFIPPNMEITITHRIPLDHPHRKDNKIPIELSAKSYTGNKENKPIENINATIKEACKLMKIDDEKERNDPDQNYNAKPFVEHLKKVIDPNYIALKQLIETITQLKTSYEHLEGKNKKHNKDIESLENKAKEIFNHPSSSDVDKTNNILTELMNCLESSRMSTKSFFRGGQPKTPDQYKDYLNKNPNDHHYARMIGLIVNNTHQKLNLELPEKFQFTNELNKPNNDNYTKLAKSLFSENTTKNVSKK